MPSRFLSRGQDFYHKASSAALFVLPYLKRLLNAAAVPGIVFARGTTLFTEEFISLKPSAISFDSGRLLAEMRKKVPLSIAVQGNLPPPGFLYSPPAVIRAETKAHLALMAGDPGFIVNLGHGILPDTPIEHVHAFIDAVVSS